MAKGKIKLLELLILGLAIAMIIGVLYAFFSDKGLVMLSGTAGTLKLAKNSETKVQYYMVGAIEENMPFIDTANNLKPGNMIDVGFHITNIGNKSAHIRDKITLTVLANDPSDMPTDILDRLVIYEYDSANPTVQRDNIRTGNDSTYTKITLIKNNSLSTANKFVYEYASAAISVMNGVGIGAEIEIGGISNFGTRYLLYFDSAASGEYQAISIEYKIRAEAMQYRNNTTPNWVGI